MRMQAYYPDSLEFDFSGIIGSIGKGIATVGKTVLTNVLTKENVSTVVSGIVARQLQKKMPTSYAFPMGSTGFAYPQPIPQPAPIVSSPQPIIVSGGSGGGVVPYTQPGVSSQAGILGMNPVILMGGVAILAILLARGR